MTRLDARPEGERRQHLCLFKQAQLVLGQTQALHGLGAADAGGQGVQKIGGLLSAERFDMIQSGVASSRDETTRGQDLA